LQTVRKLDCSKLGLEYTAYPHILRAIIQYAPDASLLVLRGTCTEYCDLIDSLLFSHVVAAIPAGKRRGRDIELRDSSSPYRRLPFLPWQATEAPGARKAVRTAARKRQLGYVSVVDFGTSAGTHPWAGVHRHDVDEGNVMHDDYFDGFEDSFVGDENSLRSATSLIAPFLGAFPSPHPVTVRRRGGLTGAGSVKLNAATYVDYHQVLHDVTLGRSHHLTRLIIPSCQKYVLHIAYDPFVPYIWRAIFDVVLPPEIEDVTLVMAPFSYDGPTDSDVDTPLGILRTMVWGFLRLVPPGVQFKIVGVENMHPSSLGFVAPTDDRFSRSDDNADIVRAMIRSLAEQVPTDPAIMHNGLRFASIPEQPTLEERREELKRISLPTFEEWEASLPEQERAILAHPPEYEHM
jgi:hypothetical protein